MYKTTPQPKQEHKQDPKPVDRATIEDMFREGLQDSKERRTVDAFDTMFPSVEAYASFFNYIIIG